MHSEEFLRLVSKAVKHFSTKVIHLAWWSNIFAISSLVLQALRAMRYTDEMPNKGRTSRYFATWIQKSPSWRADGNYCTGGREWTLSKVIVWLLAGYLDNSLDLKITLFTVTWYTNLSIQRHTLLTLSLDFTLFIS